mmetsp:Transcript_61970/g.140216  ORF Transcript_61970/g.140216 Transcript_61970/m.140216 type:complete len:315 (+) Transcript_61970:455-1399(+)
MRGGCVIFEAWLEGLRVEAVDERDGVGDAEAADVARRNIVHHFHQCADRVRVRHHQHRLFTPEQRWQNVRLVVRLHSQLAVVEALGGRGGRGLPKGVARVDGRRARPKAPAPLEHVRLAVLLEQLRVVLAQALQVPVVPFVEAHGLDHHHAAHHLDAPQPQAAAPPASISEAGTSGMRGDDAGGLAPGLGVGLRLGPRRGVHGLQRQLARLVRALQVRRERQVEPVPTRSEDFARLHGLLPPLVGEGHVAPAGEHVVLVEQRLPVPHHHHAMLRQAHFKLVVLRHIFPVTDGVGAGPPGHRQWFLIIGMRILSK